jgi:hypothetical protein
MPTETKADPFKPGQPQIPGVPAKVEAKQRPAPPRPAVQPLPVSVPQSPLWPPSLWPVWLRVGLAGAVVVIILALAWRARVSSAKQPEPPPAAPVAADAPAAAKPVQALPVGPGVIGPASDLEKPWSSMRFLFRNPVTSEVTSALAVRLPGGALWGISLREPYGTCELGYVTDLATLRSQYNFHAQHPMVVDPCSGAVFDLAQYTGGPGGLVRGAIVQGNSIRPPFAIEIVERGGSIAALRIE